MEGRTSYEALAILILIFANGFFVLSEFAVIASRKTRLRQKAREGKKSAVIAEQLSQHPEKFLATVQIGITVLGTLAGVFGGASFIEEIEKLIAQIPIEAIANSARGISLVVIAIVISGFTMVIGELIPKYLALSNPERWATLVATPLNLFIKATSFISRILSWITILLLRPFGITGASRVGTVTEEEINLMILEGKHRGEFDEIEEQLVRSVFTFGDSTVRRAMTPRTDVVAIDATTPPEKILPIITEHGYSRYPVFEKTIDNIVGVIYTKDLIYQRMDPYLIVLKDLIRKPMFVPESMRLSRLLKDFQRKKMHIAIVLDEFGGTAGVITFEDILEELVGEIQDEYDTESTPLVKQSDTIAFADGLVWPGEVNELMGTQLKFDEVDTLAGLVIDHLGRVPETNEQIEVDGVRISVLKKEKNRLTRLKLEKLPPVESETD